MYIMKKTIFSLVLLLCCMVAEKVSAQIVQPQQAVQFVRSIIVGNDSCDYYLARVGSIAYPDDPSHKMGEAWLVFVDEEPNSGWEHPCKYVYIKVYQQLQRDRIYFVVDSVCPPDNIKLAPMYKPNRYGEKGKMKPYVPKVLSNDPNPAAENTYAVILNGGMGLTSNNERYWNDCSFIYKTLRNTYGIPKGNIKVIMSDGTDEGEDMSLIDGNYCSSPLDLDDDSIPDIEYAATKENIQTVLNGMAQKLTDDDHLMIFVTGHGGYDYKTNSSYMYLWKKDKLYPNELNSYLEPIDAGFISIVMGQCYSGGFIEPLKKTNRIIATACAEKERSYGSTTIPFDEFLYHWTSAVNGYDAYGNDVYGGKNVTLLTAQRYAAGKDDYARGNFKYGKETPLVNYFLYSVAENLSLAKIPPVVDLCIEKRKGIVSSVLKTKRYEDCMSWISHAEQDYVSFPMSKFWNSPYIWLRNERDGVEHQQSETLNVREDKPIYIYLRVRNRGVKDYKTRDAKVRGYWTNSSVAINEYGWKGFADPENINPNDTVVGGALSAITLKEDIPAGGSYIECLKKTFENDEIDYAQVEDFNVCVLLYVMSKDMSSRIPFDEDKIAEVWNTNKLGQSNLTLLERTLNDVVSVDLANTSRLSQDYILSVSVADKKELLSVAELSVNFSSDIKSLLENLPPSTGGANKPLRVQNNSTIFNIKGMAPFQKGRVGIECHFLADEEITERKVYDVDMELTNKATGKSLGGETFRIIQYPRPAINPQIESVRNNGMTTLTATNVSENVIYKWYDAQGTLVGEGETFAVPAGASATSYKVKAEALSDGAISYSASVQAESSSINSVQSTTGAVNVILEGPANGGTTLRLASATGNVPVMEYSVETGSTVCSIPADNLPSGVYQVTMVENGVVTGIKKFTK